ncbi:C39 family peptidase [Pelagibius litoralis]|uniref:C39 family peptidase n=2 Tax=Pelagibius litoralis TaxID=374515 RepID=A0A967F368_9PROT|nr:C39 family peptidase [Pelagibius litoralis]
MNSYAWRAGLLLVPLFILISLHLVTTPTIAAEKGFVKSLLEVRRERVVVQNWDLSCGAAALTTLLNYQHGDMVGEREVAIGLIGQSRYIENPSMVRLRHGFSLFDLKRYVDARGYEGIGYGRMILKDLVRKAPLMVPIVSNGYKHFVVFRGQMGNRVLLADPAYGNRTMSVAKFERSWIDYGAKIGKVGFVVARRDGPAPPRELAPRPEEFLTLQ